MGGTMARKLRLKFEGAVYHVIDAPEARKPSQLSLRALSRRRGEAGIPQLSRRGVRPGGLAAARMVCDVETLSPGNTSPCESSFLAITTIATHTSARKSDPKTPRSAHATGRKGLMTVAAQRAPVACRCPGVVRRCWQSCPPSPNPCGCISDTAARWPPAARSSSPRSPT